MIEEHNRAKQQLNIIEKFIYKVLNRHNLLQGNDHFGVVTEIISNRKLKVIIDDGDVSQTISCNPDVPFAIGNRVLIRYINGNPRDKYAISRL